MGDRQNLDIYANNMWMQKKYILLFATKKSYDQQNDFWIVKNKNTVTVKEG